MKLEVAKVLLAGDTTSKIVNLMIPMSHQCLVMPEQQRLLKIRIENKSYFIFHSNGKKFDTIIQPLGGFRHPTEQIINNKNVFDTSAKRNLSNLFMDGTEVFVFAINVEPKAYNRNSCFF